MKELPLSGVISLDGDTSYPDVPCLNAYTPHGEVIIIKNSVSFTEENSLVFIISWPQREFLKGRGHQRGKF